MRSSSVFRFALFCNLVITLSSRDIRQETAVQLIMPKEREAVTREMMEEYMSQKDDIAGPVLDLALAGVGAAKTLSTIDYSKSSGEVAVEVVNALAPVIGSALALVPGVGPFISGLFMGVWSLISPLFAPKNENPMEKMIHEFAKKMELKMDEKLSSVINRAMHGEITRNNYICNKYNFYSRLFSKKFEANITLNVSDALKVTGFLNDCDNFLKDTAEAFVYDEYSDVLWVPSAITTFVRVSFLTEIIKFGHLMGIHQKITAMYFKELQDDIERQFNLYYKGHEKLRDQLHSAKIRYKDYEDNLPPHSKVHDSACLIQTQLWYFDRALYPYGIPQMLNVTALFSEINIADYYDPKNDGTVKHLQMFFDVYRHNYPGGMLPSRDAFFYRNLRITNCIMGPINHRLPTVFWFIFNPIPLKEYSYEFRIMYLHPYERVYNGGTRTVPVLIAEKKSNSEEFLEYEAIYANRNLGKPDDKGINLKIQFVKPSDSLAKGAKKIIDVPIVAPWDKCPYFGRGATPDIMCQEGVKFFKGWFQMYSAGAYNLRRNEVINKIIRVGNPRYIFQGRATEADIGFLAGAEIIVRQLI